MRYFLVLLFLLIPGFIAGSDNNSLNSGLSEDKNIYSGGMHILQPSYLMFQNAHGDFTATGNGIGGILRFYIGSHMTAGIYGGSQRVNYSTGNSKDSYVSLGYGSLFFGFTHKSGKFRYTSSMGVGRGSIKNLHIEGQAGEELTEAYLYDFGTIVYVPFVSVDYDITERLLLTMQISYFMANDMKYQSPVIKAGLLFNR